MEAKGGGVSDEEIEFELKNSESAWDEVRRLLQTLNEAAPLGFGRDSTSYVIQWRGASLNVTKYSRSEESRADRQKMEAARALSSPFIIGVLGVTPDEPMLVVTRFMAGGDLENYLIKQAPNGIIGTQLRELTIDIINGLQYLHTHDIIHRDLKPSNIFLEDLGEGKLRARIGDFGTARLLGSDMTPTVGTFAFMAPEVADSVSYNTKVDIYSFAMVVFCMVTGRTGPWDDTSPLQIVVKVAAGGRPEFPEDKVIPERIRELIEAGWNQQPSERPSADEMLKLLDEIPSVKHSISSELRRDPMVIPNMSGRSGSASGSCSIC